MIGNTSQNNKRIAKNSLLLYCRTMFTMLISLYTSRVILSTLGVDDYGVYNVVGGFVAMFSLMSSSLTSSTQRFITFELGKKNHSQTRAVFSSAVVIHCLLSIIVLIVAEGIGIWFLNSKMNIPASRIVAANWVFQCSLLTFIIDIVSIPYNAMIIAYEKMQAFAYISILEAVLKLSIVILLPFLHYDKLIIYGILMMMVAVVIRIVYGIYCNRNFSDSYFIWVKEKKYYKQMTGFAGWNFIGSSSGILTNYGVNILLNLFFGVAINAARGVATQVDGALNQFVSNFMTAINPQITKSYASGNYTYMMTLINKGACFSFYLLLFMALPVLFETQRILTLWLKVVPNYTIIFVRLSLIYTMCQSLSQTLYTAMLATGKIKRYQLVVGGLSLLTFPISYLFLWLGYSPISCYIVSISISIICLVARLYMLKPMINLSITFYLKNVVCKILIVLLASLLVPLLLEFILSYSYLKSIVLIITSTFFTALSVLYLGLNLSERKYIYSTIRNKLLRNGI
ncbi:lipopolysaccharide biosynthesis protein [uncultured Bacteroides sp.]|uniref:lipopolysaccharide biosynthesis protein n=1 Tax=uncultured Bacteroides sp. TaxID=162156 RepID=UPI002AABA28D|nr:lipopolysaccharide biosynthesis protein [uncultured Bacteroides sp.]